MICERCKGEGEIITGDCPDCLGSGTFEGYCLTCSGSGQGSHDGSVCPTCRGRCASVSDCQTCNGTGKEKKECPDCEGTGFFEDDEDEKPKPNHCTIVFQCRNSSLNPCALFREDKQEPGFCRHSKNGLCHSAVAMANTMVIEFKKIGLEVCLSSTPRKA